MSKNAPDLFTFWNLYNIIDWLTDLDFGGELEGGEQGKNRDDLDDIAYHGHGVYAV